jgi:hypothetical protein
MTSRIFQPKSSTSDIDVGKKELLAETGLCFFCEKFCMRTVV